jgi:hypothetical protein
MEELPKQWKEAITVHIYKKDNKTGCSNYRGILSLLPTTSVAKLNTTPLRRKFCLYIYKY